MRWSVRHAYDNVPFYRASFDAAGVHPEDVKTLADLALLPFTAKADLRDNYPFGMFAVPRERVARIHASSGTTGKATVVGYTSETPELSPHSQCRLERSGSADRERPRNTGEAASATRSHGLLRVRNSVELTPATLM